MSFKTRLGRYAAPPEAPVASTAPDSAPVAWYPAPYLKETEKGFKFDAYSYDEVNREVVDLMDRCAPDFLLCRMNRYEYEDDTKLPPIAKEVTRAIGDVRMGDGDTESTTTLGVLLKHYYDEKNHAVLERLILFSVLTMDRMSAETKDFWMTDCSPASMHEDGDGTHFGNLLERLTYLSNYMYQKNTMTTFADTYVRFINAVRFRQALGMWIHEFTKNGTMSKNIIYIKYAGSNPTGLVKTDITLPLENVGMKGDANLKGSLVNPILFFETDIFLFERVSNWLLTHIVYLMKTGEPTLWIPVFRVPGCKSMGKAELVRILKTPDLPFDVRIQAFLDLKQFSFETDAVVDMMKLMLVSNWAVAAKTIKEMGSTDDGWMQRYLRHAMDLRSGTAYDGTDESESVHTKISVDYHTVCAEYTKLGSTLPAETVESETGIISSILLAIHQAMVRLSGPEMQVSDVDLITSLLQVTSEMEFKARFDMLVKSYEMKPTDKVVYGRVITGDDLGAKAFYARIRPDMRKKLVERIAGKNVVTNSLVIPKYMQSRVNKFVAFLNQLETYRSDVVSY